MPATRCGPLSHANTLFRICYHVTSSSNVNTASRACCQARTTTTQSLTQTRPLSDANTPISLSPRPPVPAPGEDNPDLSLTHQNRLCTLLLWCEFYDMRDKNIYIHIHRERERGRPYIANTPSRGRSQGSCSATWRVPPARCSTRAAAAAGCWSAPPRSAPPPSASTATRACSPTRATTSRRSACQRPRSTATTCCSLAARCLARRPRRATTRSCATHPTGCARRCFATGWAAPGSRRCRPT